MQRIRVVYPEYPSSHSWRVGYYTIIPREGLHNYFIPCHTKYSGQMRRLGVIHAVELHWSMGRFVGILTNIQRFSCILIGSIFYGMHGMKVRIQVSKCWFSSLLQYPWMHHLSTIFSKNTLKDDEEIIVPALPYLQNMTRIIKETPKRYGDRLCLCQDKLTKICRNCMGIITWELQIVKGVSNGLCENLRACEQCVYFCVHEQWSIFSCEQRALWK